MKIQCPCGTKLAFEITPDMATNPVQFICPVCGQDSSVMVNQLVRQELGLPVAAAAAAPASVAMPAPVATISIPQQPAPAPAPAPSIRIASPSSSPAPAQVLIPVPSAAPKPAMRVATHSPAASSATPVEAAPGAPVERQFCLKHPGQEIGHKCVVCGKGMCPDCMALFGYVCSPLCKTKAVSRGIDVPVYAMQKSVVEAARWRKISRIAGSIGAVAAVLVGFWFWYAWFGCKPRVAYAMRFEAPANAGQLRLCKENQMVFIRDGELGRIDMKSSTPEKPVWTKQLVDKSKFGPLADATIAQSKKARDKYADEVGEASHFKIPDREELIADMFQSAVDAMQLHVAGENIWVLSEGKLSRFDWQTGAPSKEVVLEGSSYGLQRKGDELVSEETNYEDPTLRITRHISLVTGETTKETTQTPIPPRLIELLTAAATNKSAKVTAGNKTTATAVAAATKKITAANEARRPDAPLNPQTLADQAQKLSYAGKIALPALIANARNQQRIFAEMAGTSDDEEKAPRRQPTELDLALMEWDSTRVVPGADGPVQFSRILLERKTIKREAMKAPPKKPALDENVSAGRSLETAVDMLNEMQREAGSTVEEDASRYKVTVRRGAAGIPEFTAEVVSTPSFHPLKTMDIITAGTKAIAIDHSNKKLWEASLNFSVSGGRDLEDVFDEESGESESGLGPCVERGDTIFIYDKGSLAAFDRNTGEARWRLPSAGIAGLWFDDKGMLYVNTTTAGGDSIRYSKQISMNNQPMTLILKVDPKTGKTLWDCQAAKHISYMWKKYIYTTDQFRGTDPDEGGLAAFASSGTKPFLRIRRIDASTGRVVWEHVQERCPLDLHFHENTIQIMFKKEVQHLKILML